MLQLTKTTIGLTPQEWKKVGDYANKLIQNDMTQGKFQNNQSNLQYRSQQYKRYKSSGMQLQKFRQSRLVNPETGKVIRNMKKKTKKSKGRLFNYYGKQIDSTNTAFVDMTLTGTLKKSLHVVRSWESGVESGYQPGDNASGKILGNRRYGREVLGLSIENMKKVKEFIQEIMRRHIKDFSQTVNIEVKF